MVCFSRWTQPWWLPFALATFVVWIARRRRWLDETGQWAALGLGVWIFGYGGWRWSAPILLFFVSSSLLSWLPSRNLDQNRPPRGRGARQVLANGLVPAAALAGCLFGWEVEAWWMYTASLAVSTADTWATEVGTRLSPWAWSLQAWRRVPPGESGAVSPTGLSASLLGAGLLGGVAAWLFPGGAFEDWRGFALVTLAGFTGALFDSFLGAFVQARLVCSQCQEIVEKGASHTCQASLRWVKGLPWLDNDAVNFLASLWGALAAILLGERLFSVF